MDAIWAPTLACWLAGPGPLLSGQMWAHCYGFFSFPLACCCCDCKSVVIVVATAAEWLNNNNNGESNNNNKGAANARTSRCCFCCWPRLEASSFLVREHPNYPPAHLQFCAHPTHFTTTTPSFGRRTDFCSLAFIASASVSALKYAALSRLFPLHTALHFHFSTSDPLYAFFIYSLFLFTRPVPSQLLSMVFFPLAHCCRSLIIMWLAFVLSSVLLLVVYGGDSNYVDFSCTNKLKFIL